eukprot:10750420-Lingulodinium_polyedra.AAC.1
MACAGTPSGAWHRRSLPAGPAVSFQEGVFCGVGPRARGPYVRAVVPECLFNFAFRRADPAVG